MAGILLLAVIAVGIYLVKNKETRQASISTFEECVAAGNEILTTNPAQCKTDDGRTFTQGTGGVATTTPNPEARVVVYNVAANATVQSPLVITGKARGWYFEASFPVKMLDANGKVLGNGYAQALTDWMTEDFVEFKSTLTFATSTTPTGTLVLMKDNPSGLPQYDEEIRIPVKFSSTVSAQERTVKLYYYNASKDKDLLGNILCSDKGIVAVDRKIPVTNTPIQDSIKLLLKGELTQTERNQGITTEYPLAGFELVSASAAGSTLTLTFKDPQNKTSGGACRVSILRAQIEAVAKQFSGVSTVRIMPEGILQP